LADGIFCCNDNLAIQVQEITQQFWGQKAPKIVGFDGILSASAMVQAGTLLATIDQNIDAQASLAVAEIIQIIRGKTRYMRAHKTDIQLEPLLITRRSH
jgi:ABC-type sugar transport system substrate-binding protein